MKVEIECKNGVYREGMKIWCKALNYWCGNQRFKNCKGWWVLTDNASRCPKRKENSDGQDAET